MEDASGVPLVLPRGRHALDEDVVHASQQTRLLNAMVSVCAEKGYAKTTVADVVKRSGVSRKTFYEFYDDKQACLLAAYEVGMAAVFDHVAGAIAESGGPEIDALRLAVGAYLDALAQRPEFARLIAIEMLGAGPEVRAVRDTGFERFVGLYSAMQQEAHARDPEIPEPDEQLIVAAIGAVAELIRRTVSREGAAALPGIKEVAIDVTWTLMSGTQPAPR